jgi:hypothetical protein
MTTDEIWRWHAIPFNELARIQPYQADARPKCVIWLDPGATTGYAIWHPHNNQFESGELHADDVGEWLHFRMTFNWLGWETFTLRPGSVRITKDLSAAEVIGVAKYVIRACGGRQLVPQQPADRMLGQKHIAAAGWQNPGKNHANDAASHLLSWALGHNIAPASVTESP